MTEAVAGVDWASEKHDVLIEDLDGVRVWAGEVAHDEQGISELCSTLLAAGVIRVAVERPDGLLIERLLDAGLVVLALHPNQVKAARPRFSVSGGKTDRFDAFVLAELARTDHHRFRALTPDSDATKALRAFTRGRGELMGLRRSLCNQLRAQLERCWPGVIGAFPDLHRQIVLAFLERWPTADDAARLTERQLAAFLAKQHYSGRRTPTQLLERLRSAPTGRAGQAETDARRHIVRGLIAALSPIVDQITLLDRQIADAVRAHPDGKIFLSPFKSPDSTLTAAVLLAEIGDQRARYPTSEALAGDAGQAAVAVESGKKKVATFRRACDHRLRDAFCVLADTSRHHNPWAHRLYADARARGHDHQRAIRTLGRAWSRVLWRCWQDRTPYNPERHRALQRQLTVTIPASSGTRPDLAATQRIHGTAVTKPAARRAEREALDGTPTSAISPGG
jgi:transposase